MFPAYRACPVREVFQRSAVARARRADGWRSARPEPSAGLPAGSAGRRPRAAVAVDRCLGPYPGQCYQAPAAFQGLRRAAAGQPEASRRGLAWPLQRAASQARPLREQEIPAVVCPPDRRGVAGSHRAHPGRSGARSPDGAPGAGRQRAVRPEQAWRRHQPAEPDGRRPAGAGAAAPWGRRPAAEVPSARQREAAARQGAPAVRHAAGRAEPGARREGAAARGAARPLAAEARDEALRLAAPADARRVGAVAAAQGVLQAARPWAAPSAARRGLASSRPRGLAVAQRSSARSVRAPASWRWARSTSP